MNILKEHSNKDQYPFKNNSEILLPSFRLYRDNRFTKLMINNRHDLKMSNYNNAGYGYQIFSGSYNIGSVWFLNQVNAESTYVRVSRYESYRNGYFIAVLSELSDMFNSEGYSLLLKTQIKFAQEILDKNFESKQSKKVKGKRGKNDRSKKNTSVDGITYYLSEKLESYEKWHDEVSIIDA